MPKTNIGLNWLNSNATNFEATYPLLRLLLLGPILRSLTQRDGEERERIFKRPPLPWRESRGATGVKTPDNQSGILKFHRLHRFKTKPPLSTLENRKGSAFENSLVCGPNELPIYSATWLIASTVPPDSLEAVPERVDCEWVNQIWG